MQKKLIMALAALSSVSVALAQEDSLTVGEAAFSFTEAQLGEDDDMTQNVSIVHSNTNLYASDVSYLFSPTRFRYRAFNQKYNSVYINGAPQNDMESGQFRFSSIGGLNRLTRNVDYTLPFESNTYDMPNMGGSNNYDFRAGSMQAGNYVSLGAANRNYTLRGMYTYSTGFNARGWALAGGLTYRWAERGYVEGTFYNSLSYFLGFEKRWKNGHAISFTTWGNPTERASQGASTDEAYWLANDYYYNPYWGYQNGKKRNSRVVNDFAPSAIFTWDWDICDKLQLTTTAYGKYSMYKSTKLNYSNSENPQPDYWKNMPSSYYEVWDGDVRNNEFTLAQWQRAVDWWQASKANRQIDFDALYAANRARNGAGGDALYYIQAKYNNNLMFNLASTLKAQLSEKQILTGGIILGQNRGRHYQKMDDLLGGYYYHNINTYALGTYGITDPRVQYDLNHPNALVAEGDKFGYDYQIEVRQANIWSTYTEDFGNVHYFLAGRLNYDDMRRKGYMRNGMFADNSYGHSKLAKFLTGGMKFGANIDLSNGQVFTIGLGYEHRAPQASTAFVAPEMNNDFVANLTSERVFSSELGYQYQNSWLHFNLQAYYSNINHGTEWQNFYFDDINSFSYVSMTGIKRSYYGLEGAARVKLTSFLDFKALGTISDAKYTNNANLIYLSSTNATYNDATNGAADQVMTKDMRESGTPLTATSLGLSFHQNGWYIDLNANWYDRIYLSFSPCTRYASTLVTAGNVDNDGNYIVPDQTKGHGGWMFDGSIGKTVRLKTGQLSFNLMVTNILNNQHIVTGGYEQSRSDYTTTNTGDRNNNRIYKFSRNPKKYYIFGTNGMFQVSYRF